MVQIEPTPILVNAGWDAEQGVVRYWMHPDVAHICLAHELGHQRLGHHEFPMDPYLRWSMEVAAWQWAKRRLVSAESWDDLAQEFVRWMLCTHRAAIWQVYPSFHPQPDIEEVVGGDLL